MIHVIVEKKFCEEHETICLFAKITDDNDDVVVSRALANIFTLPYEGHLPRVLAKLFGTHECFYRAIGFNYSNSEHSPIHNCFTTSCTGYQKFVNEFFKVTSVKDIDQSGLQKIANTIAVKLSEIVSRYVRDLNTYVSAVANVSISHADSNVSSILDPSIANESLLVCNNGVYKVFLVKTNCSSLEDVRKEVVESIRKSYEIQLNSKIAVLKKQVEYLSNKLEEVKMNVFVEGMKVFNTLNAKGWVIENGVLVLKKRISATHIKFKDMIYELPREYVGKFWVDSLRVPIDVKVYNVWVDNAYHPNVLLPHRTVCLGDLEGRGIVEVLENIERMLEVVNLDSAYSNNATEDAREMLSKMDILAYEENEEGDLEEVVVEDGGDVWTV